MANKVKGGYRCGYCGKFFTSPVEADACKESHNLIYVAISPEDLNKLINFIYTKEDRLLSDTLVQRLQNYLRSSFNLDVQKDR